MLKFLEKLRALPEKSRKMVVLFSSSFFTAIFLVSWFVFPVPHFGAFSQEERERKSAESLVAPFSVIGGEFNRAFGDIKEKWASSGGIATVASSVFAIKESMTGEGIHATTSSMEEVASSTQISATTTKQ